MEELFELIDKNGRDIKIIVTNDPYKHPHPIIRVESIEHNKPKQEFKIPGWYIYHEFPYWKKVIFYANGIEGEYLHSELNGCNYLTKYCRSATPQEIETYLVNICNEKGLKPGVKFHPLNNPLLTMTMTDKYWYNGDQFHIIALREEWKIGCSDPIIYKQGKFAEIILDKKKLPKTREEFEKFIKEYSSLSGLNSNYNVHSFLNNFLMEYED